MKIYVFLGPPGVGKGTQAKRVADEMKFNHLSTGDLLRAAIKDGTDLGKTAKGFIEKGELVPDNVICGVVVEKLRSMGKDSVLVLDGFPRTIPQADALGNASFTPTGVINFTCPDSMLIERIAGRRTCKKCSTNFHIKFQLPKKEGVCDACGGELYQRKDDTEAVVKERLQVYQKQTAPLIEYYTKKNLIVNIDGTGKPEAIFANLKKSLQ